MQKLKGVFLQWAWQTKEIEKRLALISPVKAVYHRRTRVSASWPAASVAVAQDLVSYPWKQTRRCHAPQGPRDERTACEPYSTCPEPVQQLYMPECGFHHGLNLSPNKARRRDRCSAGSLGIFAPDAMPLWPAV